MLGPPLVERRAADPMLTAQLRCGHPAFRVTLHALDLGFGATALLCRNLPVHPKILRPHPLNQGDDYPRQIKTSGVEFTHGIYQRPELW